ncbi:MAG: hypothetical protein KDA28_15055 [Phycisphaerales bacterium]|nr:hypothetical protein [Phycisphaerales bacterium]
MTPVPTQLTINATANAPRESARESECTHRSRGSCALVSGIAGCKVKVTIEACDRCFALGPETDDADSYRTWLGTRSGAAALGRISSMPRPDRATILGTLSPSVRSRALRSAADRLGVDEASRLAESAGVLDSDIRGYFAGRDMEACSAMVDPAIVRESVMATWEDAESWSMAQRARGFLAAMWSRIFGPRLSAEAYRVRRRSCFGDDRTPACPSLAWSDQHGARFCNSCGCGEREIALLEAPTKGRAAKKRWFDKLRYPRLKCPRRRDGFHNAEKRA